MYLFFLNWIKGVKFDRDVNYLLLDLFLIVRYKSHESNNTLIATCLRPVQIMRSWWPNFNLPNLEMKNMYFFYKYNSDQMFKWCRSLALFTHSHCKTFQILGNFIYLTRKIHKHHQKPQINQLQTICVQYTSSPSNVNRSSRQLNPKQKMKHPEFRHHCLFCLCCGQILAFWKYRKTIRETMRQQTKDDEEVKN